MSKRGDFCRCLYEIENNLPITQHCFMACDAQYRILAEREKNRNKETHMKKKDDSL